MEGGGEIFSFSNILWVLAFGSGGILALIYTLQDYLLYFPQVQNARNYFIEPQRFDLPNPEEVYLRTPEEIKINVWVFKQEDAAERPTMLFFHGNAGNVSFTLPCTSRFFCDLKYNLVLMEYQGFGKSEGWPHQKGILENVGVTIDWIKSDDALSKTPLLLFGQSLGGAVAIHTAALSQYKNQFLGVVVENTFTSVLDMIDLVFPIFKYFKFMVRNPWKSIDQVRNISCPILFLSGEKDELVPPIMTRKLKEEMEKETKNNVRYVSFPEGSHMETWTDPNYFPIISMWVDENIDALKRS